MKEHDLRTWPSEWSAIARGEKRFEIRVNDRDYAAGDRLLLRMWDPAARPYGGGLSPGGYIGYGTSSEGNGPTVSDSKDALTIVAKVTHLTQGRFGLPYDLCVMSIEVETAP